MISLFNTRRPLALIVLLTFTILTVLLPSARASMVTTHQILKERKDNQCRERLYGLLNRAEVQENLQKWGVESDIAKSCIDSLTDEEVAQIVGGLDKHPAGGSAIIGAAVLIFLVLLVTDITGLTDVFPFVNK